ncbi:MAG: hypothetical protein V3T77_03355 [Planctomycetota bacterium]
MTRSKARRSPQKVRAVSLRPLLLGVLALSLIGSALWIRARVDAQVAAFEGPWQLRLEPLPTWWPRNFRGALGALEQLPATVPLRSPRWRSELSAALEKNRWIERVQELTRHGSQIHFRAAFCRPVVAVRTRNGYLLVDSSAEVIDHQFGEALAQEWGVPLYIPEQDLASPRAVGSSLEGAEFKELQSLMEVLWDARILERWWGVITEVACSRRENGERHWYLRLRNSAWLVWGRAPNSSRPSVLTPAEKLHNLEETLVVWRSLDAAGEVNLSVDRRPLVIRPQ